MATSTGVEQSKRRRLMVIIPDRISALVAKGEITDRYYNPGDLFDEVHLVLVNDDHPDPAAVAKTVGRARLHLHNLPDPRVALFLATLGWRPWLLRIWARRAVRLARAVEPDLVRCHAAQLNAFAAAEIRRRTGIPYVVSLHINPAADLRPAVRGLRSLARRIVADAREAHARIAIREASAVACVYDFIVPYAERAGARRVETLYNVVAPGELRIKDQYALGTPPRVIVVGRQIAAKDPEPVLRAMVDLPEVHLTLVGDGPLHGDLQRLAAALGTADRTTFIRAIPNGELLSLIRDHDVLVSVNDFGGVSKVELEAAMIGMPVITNDHPAELLPEVLGANCVVVDGTPASYAAACSDLLADEERRRRLGTALRASVAHLHADRTEPLYAKLYCELLDG